MPIPFIAAGVASAAAITGLKKGNDARKDYKKAKETNENAESIYNSSKSRLESAQRTGKKQLQALGEFKYKIYTNELENFVLTFSQIKKIEIKDVGDNLLESLDFMLTDEEIREVKEVSLKMKEVVSGLGTAGAAGAMSGFGAMGAATYLGTASTGTAISALSGVAAKNATLAWFGGGSLASGGLGMAGGTAILGGIVAGPVVAVAGWVAANKAAEAKETAISNLAQAKAACNEMDTASTAADAINRRTMSIHKALKGLLKIYQELYPDFFKLVLSNNDYSTYTQQDKKGVAIITSVVKVMTTLMKVDVFDKDGNVTRTSEEALFSATKLSRTLKSM